MPPQHETEILHLLEENTAVVRENNRLLKKMHRNAIVEIWLRVLWYALLIGLPFALYFYILEPYLKTFGSSLEQFGVGVGTFPGMEALKLMLEKSQQQ